MSEPEHTPAPLLPLAAFAAIIACVAGAAALANCAVISALLKRSRNGLFSIIIQLAIADILVLGTTIAPELWVCNLRSWYFGNTGCTIYQGMNVFISTASLYLVAAVALHTLTTINLGTKTSELRRKRNVRDEDIEIRSSQHSLVANSDSSTPPRTMNVDYRLAATSVPVTLPTFFVWVLAASLSVPEFALATTIRLEKDIVLCTLDSSHRFNMYSMLTVFNIFVPLFIMSTASVLIIVKMKSKKNPIEIDNCESTAALKLALWLIVVHFLLCTPRAVFNAYNVYAVTTTASASKFVHSPGHATAIISLSSSFAYLLATLIRPLLCIIILPRVRKVFSFGYIVSENV